MIGTVGRRSLSTPLAVGGRVPAVVGALLVLAIVGGTSAHWGATGSGSGGGKVDTLGVPSVTALPGSGTATLNWTAAPTPDGSSASYYVSRNGGDPAGDCPRKGSETAVVTCTDTGLGRGTYTYVVTTVWRSWTSTSGPATATLISGALDHFVAGATTTTPQAGQAATVKITAFDVAGNVVSGYSGTQCLIFSGPSASPNGTVPLYPAQGSCATGQSAISFASGTATAPVTLYRVETASLVVADAAGHKNGSGLSLAVGPASAVSFSMPTPASQIAGVAFAISMTAVDSYGNTATGYTGSHCLTFSGPLSSPNGTAPKYPTGGSCAAGQSPVMFATGSASGVPITLYNPAPATVLGAADAASIAAGSTGPFAVAAGSAATFAIATPTSQTAGAQFQVSLTATDGYGSTATTYSGTKCLTFSGPASSPNGTAPSYPAPGGCSTGGAVAFASGTATAALTLYAADPLTVLTATAGTMTGSTGSFAVAGGPLHQFSLSAASANPLAGAADNLQIQAIDSYGNIAAGYSGVHSLTFSGAASVTGSPFTPSVSNSAGVATAFGSATTLNFVGGIAQVSGSSNGAMRLYKSGPASVSVTDGANTSNGLSVTVSVAAVMVSAGAYHTCAVLSYGGIECWGQDNDGQLGDGTTAATRTTPVAVGGIANATAVSAGMDHTCALLGDGTVKCWGLNTYGQLGDGTTTTRTAPVVVSGLTGATEVSAGWYGTCAVISGGAARCWGRNNYGQVGDGTTTTRTTPAAVNGLTGASTISTAWYQTCAVLTDHTARCWGRNNYGQLGDGTTATRTTPTAVSGVTTAATITTGAYTTCAVLTDHTARCWGRNNDGQVGDGTTATRTTPTAVSGISTAVGISSGYYHTCALMTDQSARCWGWNAQGQIGDGTTATRTSPVTVGGGFKMTQISAGGGNANNVEHSAALLSDGSVDCWGDNTYGQLGNGTTTASRTPVPVALQ